MLDSQIGFLHLVWVILSFFIPTRWFYTGSVIIFFPVILAEFAFIYFTNT